MRRLLSQWAISTLSIFNGYYPYENTHMFDEYFSSADVAEKRLLRLNRLFFALNFLWILLSSK